MKLGVIVIIIILELSTLLYLSNLYGINNTPVCDNECLEGCLSLPSCPSHHLMLVELDAINAARDTGREMYLDAVRPLMLVAAASPKR